MLQINIPCARTKFAIGLTNECLNKTLFNFLEAIRLYYYPYVYDCRMDNLDIDNTYLFIIDEGRYDIVYNDKTFTKEYTTQTQLYKDIILCIRNNLICNNEYAILHGSSLEINGVVFTFLGESGMGKTTLTAYLLYDLSCKLLSEDWTIINHRTMEIIPYPGLLKLRKGSIHILNQYSHINGTLKNATYNKVADRYYLEYSNCSDIRKSEIMMLLVREPGRYVPKIVKNKNVVDSVMDNIALPFQIRNSIFLAYAINSSCSCYDVYFNDLPQLTRGIVDMSKRK